MDKNRAALLIVLLRLAILRLDCLMLLLFSSALALKIHIPLTRAMVAL
jgi:hypothetical protein